MTETTVPLGENTYVVRGPVPIGWTVKLGLEPFAGGFALVARCSCGDFVARDNGSDAWDRVSQNMGIHVEEAHLKKLRIWAKKEGAQDIQS